LLNFAISEQYILNFAHTQLDFTLHLLYWSRLNQTLRLFTSLHLDCTNQYRTPTKLIRTPHRHYLTTPYIAHALRRQTIRCLCHLY